MIRMERVLERLLWSSRLLTMVAVVASVFVAIGIFVFVTLDVVDLLGKIVQYLVPALPESAQSQLRLDLLSQIVDVVDGYLLAAVLLIFALGLYELFVSRIDLAENSPFASRLLLIHSLDDLKDRLAKVVVLMLIIKFFQVALDIKFTSPLELLYLAVGIILIGGALYLTHSGDRRHPESGT